MLAGEEWGPWRELVRADCQSQELSSWKENQQEQMDRVGGGALPGGSPRTGQGWCTPCRRSPIAGHTPVGQDPAEPGAPWATAGSLPPQLQRLCDNLDDSQPESHAAEIRPCTTASGIFPAGQDTLSLTGSVSLPR